MKRLAFLFFILLISFALANAQDNKQAINIRQRLLQRKNEDPGEHVDSFTSLHLMIAGNLYQTEQHVNYAYDKAEGRYNFKDEFKYIEPLLNLGDISIVNLKTSFGDNINNMFSAPDEFALAIKYSGINALMHANMHTANVDKATLKRTRDVLNDYDMFHTGAFIDQAERLGNYPLIINKKGFKIAILNYTKLPSRPGVSRDFVINELDKYYIDRDMRMVQVMKPDFVIAYFDWSDNFQDIPNHVQQEMAKYVFEKGVDLVVGTCPNIPMRIDYMDYFYNGIAREGIVAYSLGNLIASDEELNNRNGYIIDMELKKNSFTGSTHVEDWGVVPVYTYYDTTSVRGSTKVYSLPCWAVESGDILPGIPYIEKRRAVNSAYSIRKMLGASADEVQYNMTEQIVNNVAESILITSASLNNKFSQARESDLKPSPAPVAHADSGKTSSLAMVYGETYNVDGSNPPETPKKKETAYTKEKKKAADVFNSAPPVATGIGTVTEPNVPETKTVPSSIGAADSAIGTANRPDAANAASNRNDQANEGAPHDIKPANTNFHTTGNNYDLKDDNNGQRSKNISEPEPAGRKKEVVANMNSEEAGTNISTDTKAEIKADMQITTGKHLKAEVDTFYRIQFYALKRYLPLDTNYYTHLKGYEVFEEHGMFKYVLGKYSSYKECYDYWKSQIQPRYKESFIVKYINGKRVLE
jgi:poly-gamma-glutamate capsule biosynthesis protein CapA/YwtB (metallophosphatase superfamily)